MAKFSAIKLDDVDAASGYAVDRDVTGVAWSKKLSPADYSLWLAVSELHDGAVLRWTEHHGDEAVCVLEGELVTDGRICPAGGAVIVESGVAAEARAVGRTVVAHYGPVDATPPADGAYGPPRPDGHQVHVVGDKGWFTAGDGVRYEAVWWADSTCPTCRISVFHIHNPGSDERELPHHHTQDEIIYVLDGELRMGAHCYPAGTAISIPGNLRYALRGDGRPLSFLNYRRDASVIHLADGSEPILESGKGFGGDEVADFR
jgi:quercetin dioxygenase-like cupin family protein